MMDASKFRRFLNLLHNLLWHNAQCLICVGIQESLFVSFISSSAGYSLSWSFVMGNLASVLALSRTHTHTHSHISSVI